MNEYESTQEEKVHSFKMQNLNQNHSSGPSLLRSGN